MATIIIKPKSKWQLVDLNELVRYRELFYVFAWRDLKVRYKQTLLGGLWVVFQPLFSTFIFTIFFGRLAKIPSGNLPYPLFVMIGLVFWLFFSSSLSYASNSLIDNEHIIKKVYFPRLILPISAVIASLVDFFIAFLLLLIAVIYYGFSPALSILYVFPLCITMTLLSSIGLGLFLAALNAIYRDVRYILPFFIQILIFLTPVIYPVTIIRPSNRIIMAINPMTGVIETMRVVLTGVGTIDVGLLTVSFISCAIFLVIGLIGFRYFEKFIIDIL